MPQKDPLALYRQYYIERDFERLDLFQHLADRFAIHSALYPGGFVHVTPSFVYPVTVYVDNNKAAAKFFSSSAVLDFVSGQKRYEQDPSITFHAKSYMEDFGEDAERFDLLISQYAGFVSQYCSKYLKVGGVLLANNSHGDASMASLDDRLVFVAVVHKRSGKYRLSDRDLGSYLVPKSDRAVTKAYLHQIQRGIGYQKSASMYVFQRVS